MRNLAGHRLLICGKGGSGKSSFSTLLALELYNRDYDVVLIDGDASNPGGLVRLAFGAGEGPKSLLDFFGGREKVTCPVDDPSPLTRASDSMPVADSHIDLAEIPSEYYLRHNRMVLFQVGKIRRPYEGCDGPMSKVTRDFVVRGDWVTVIDVEAGIEHFGRGVEKNVDMILVLVDPSFESFEIAARVARLGTMMNIPHILAVLNAVDSRATGITMREALEKGNVPVVGHVRYDRAVRLAGMRGDALGQCGASKDVGRIVSNLETVLEPAETTERQWRAQ